MEYRTLGQSEIEVSAVSFGGGPIAGLMVGGDSASQQGTVQQALDAGVNWFDTAATYGDGQSEQALGAALKACGAASRVHIATKVRLAPEQLTDIPAAVRSSLDYSLQRLGVERVTLLQLHNSVTARRNDLPTSVSHTHKTKFFPLDLFQRDQRRAAQPQRAFPANLTLAEASLRRVLSLPGVTTALLGFASPAQVEQAVEFATQGPLAEGLWGRIRRAGDAVSG